MVSCPGFKRPVALKFGPWGGAIVAENWIAEPQLLRMRNSVPPPAKTTHDGRLVVVRGLIPCVAEIPELSDRWSTVMACAGTATAVTNIAADSNEVVATRWIFVKGVMCRFFIFLSSC